VGCDQGSESVESHSAEFLRDMVPGLAGGGRLMQRLVVRWGLAVGISLAAFALTWWLCQELAGLHEDAALGVAGAVLAVVLAGAGWWAGRERLGGPGSNATDPPLVQKGRAGRDVNIAGRDQTIINYRRPDD
jgi:hypothetical protein